MRHGKGQKHGRSDFLTAHGLQMGQLESRKVVLYMLVSLALSCFVAREAPTSLLHLQLLTGS